MSFGESTLAAAIRNEVKVVKRLTATHREVVFTVGRRQGLDLPLGRYLQALCPRYTDELLERWGMAGRLTVDEVAARADQPVVSGQLVRLLAPLPAADPTYAPPPLRLLYHDQDVIVADKGLGQLAHQAGKIMTGTLLNQLQDWVREQGGDPNQIRLVNRIDRDTAGIVLATRHLAAHITLSDAWAQRKVHKEYVAIVHGAPSQCAGHWRDPIGAAEDAVVLRCVRSDGLACHTEWRVAAVAGTPERRRQPAGQAAESDPGPTESPPPAEPPALAAAAARPGTRTHSPIIGPPFAQLRLLLHTGRQHQIRVHAAHHGHPLVGDWVYGTPCAELPGQALHAALISFPHPRTGTVVSCESPWPAPLADLWQQLENGGVPTMKPLNPEQRARLHLPAD